MCLNEINNYLKTDIYKNLLQNFKPIEINDLQQIDIPGKATNF